MKATFRRHVDVDELTGQQVVSLGKLFAELVPEQNLDWTLNYPEVKLEGSGSGELATAIGAYGATKQLDLAIADTQRRLMFGYGGVTVLGGDEIWVRGAADRINRWAAELPRAATPPTREDAAASTTTIEEFSADLEYPAGTRLSIEDVCRVAELISQLTTAGRSLQWEISLERKTTKGAGVELLRSALAGLLRRPENIKCSSSVYDGRLTRHVWANLGSFARGIHVSGVDHDWVVGSRERLAEEVARSLGRSRSRLAIRTSAVAAATALIVTGLFVWVAGRLSSPPSLASVLTLAGVVLVGSALTSTWLRSAPFGGVDFLIPSRTSATRWFEGGTTRGLLTVSALTGGLWATIQLAQYGWRLIAP
jgi:hypothetical protein